MPSDAPIAPQPPSAQKLAWIHGYHQNATLLTICGASLLMVYMRLDLIIGAVGLRVTYPSLGIVTFWGMLLLILFFLTIWNGIPTEVSILTALAIVGLAIILQVYVILLGWMIGIVVWSIPPVISIIILGMVVFIWSWGKLRPHVFSKRLIQFFTTLFLLFTAAFCIGVAFLPQNAEFDFRGNLDFRGHHYFLGLSQGWLGDPDIPILYECNVLGIMCHEVYRASEGYYWDKQVSLVPNDQTRMLLINVDGVTKGTYKPE